MTATLVTLPYLRPPKTSNESARSTGRHNSRTTKTVRREMWALAKSLKIREHTRSDVLITWWAPNAIRRDAGSLFPLLKATIDGFKDAGVWPDDHYVFVRTESCRVELDRANPRITLEITELETP
ncbi:hypothetical protein [Rhodococcus sp. B10]|uniref:hypothetical protein n=1 Tax=Rhodococcus sp. B10 TaxID=2695876 RepID=UPI00142F402F|nr:hypothetical protein [Rhodococcus sp. B10]NIL77635.1 hypothetical protein [Rhodococcus sp. B10]